MFISQQFCCPAFQIRLTFLFCVLKNNNPLDSSRLSRLSLAILNFYSLISIKIKIDR